MLSKNEVWHQIVLTNNTNLPWTTGAAMIMQGNQPLAQELLTYTPPKDEVRVPVTVSVDTRGSSTEKEIGRELKALQWDGYNYARIDKEMKLDLCNNKPIEIEAEITLRVGGKVDKASHDGDVTLGAVQRRRLGAVPRASRGEQQLDGHLEGEAQAGRNLHAHGAITTSRGTSDHR